VSRTFLTLALWMAMLLSPAFARAAEAPAPGGSRTVTVEDDSIDADVPAARELSDSDDGLYHPITLEARHILWFEPGQQGLIEANPLVMGLAAMALATVTLLFFFLRGIRRPPSSES